jgi:hypothetical protein
MLQKQQPYYGSETLAAVVADVTLALCSLARRLGLCNILFVSNRETVIALLNGLPEDTPLEEISRQIELLAGIKTARDQARNRDGVPAEEARKLVDAWVTQ